MGQRPGNATSPLPSTFTSYYVLRESKVTLQPSEKNSSNVKPIVIMMIMG